MKSEVSMALPQEPQVIAVSAVEISKFGCPHCGYRSGFTLMSGNGAAVWKCGGEECNRTSVILAEGITRSPIGVGGLYPELQPHPRRGIPAHGTPDRQPMGGGEFFNSRGIGSEWKLSCFCCGAQDKDPQKSSGLLNNIAAFVQGKASGERVVKMFDTQGGGAKLDYREREPDRVQVKIGACNEHLPNLKKLDSLVSDNIIVESKIEQAKSV